MSATVIKSAVKNTVLAMVVLTGLQGVSFAKAQPSQMTFEPGSAGSISAYKSYSSANEHAVKLAAWHHHLEINHACDDPSMGGEQNCSDDGNA
ncbi:hypothetical protein [Pantoea stewartii]|uniref:hypothetical protein n=1 Tax=Pantoea stewartii TaxID=66269 RepID=UPI003242B781